MKQAYNSFVIFPEWKYLEINGLAYHLEKMGSNEEEAIKQ